VTNGPNPQVDPLELEKLQFDYAWKWFSYHADQRVKMFNFMLIMLGVFATAIGTAIANDLHPHFTAILCFVSAALVSIFSLLDRRNQDLVWLGEEALIRLERDKLFGENERVLDRNDNPIWSGILWRQTLEERLEEEGKEVYCITLLMENTGCGCPGSLG
jgi:hypothetical protein